MASIFEQQNEIIQLISQSIDNEKEKLDKLYGKFVNGLNKTNPLNYKSIDELLISTVDDAKIFYNNFSDNKNEIVYWYDMNGKKFINKINDYNSKIIGRYDFELYLKDDFFHTKSTQSINWKPNNIYKLDSMSNICKTFNWEPINQIQCDILQGYGYQFNIHSNTNTMHVKIAKSTPSTILKLFIDENLNIIIPEIKTIIIVNYTPFPLYILYQIIYKFLDVNTTRCYNVHNNEDLQTYNIIRGTVNEFTNYLKSGDQRNKFNDGIYFENILNMMYNIEHVMAVIKYHLNFMASLNIPTNEIRESININELMKKNDSLEELVQTLEIDNVKYRSNIDEYKTLNDKLNGEIYKLNGSIVQYIEDIQKSKLENLQQSRQLIELDIIKQTINELKKQIEILNETILQHQTKEQKLIVEKQTIISKLSLQFEEIENLKKELIESRKLEKQSNDYISIVKKENLIYTSQLEEKDNTIKDLKDKISELIKPKNEITTNSSYDNVLYAQIKELQLDIEKYKKQIDDNKKDNDKITKKYNDMQNKMKLLVS